MEDAQNAPKETLQQCADVLGTRRKETFRPVIKRLGSKFKPAIPERAARPDSWSHDDITFLKASVDTEQEATLGYTY